jgi:hypothetical protein
MLALFVGQPWTLLSESNDGVAGVPEFLVVYLHPPAISFSPAARD